MDRLPRTTSLIAFLLTALLAKASTHASYGPGADQFTFVDEVADIPPITVWTYRPASWTVDGPVLFVMHGSLRNGRDYRDAWASIAQRRGCLLIVPEFSRARFPDRAYQQGNMFDALGWPNARRRWTFHVIEHLFDNARAATGATRASYLMYGHSAGGQFVHRFVLFMPNSRCERAVAANAGWYTMPSFNQPFPYGLRASGLPVRSLRGALTKELIVLLGERDVGRDAPRVRATPEAEAQGPNRFERGRRFHAAARSAATSLGGVMNWDVRVAPGAPHCNDAMIPSAADVLFATD